jgi:hypothetical protein
MSKKAGKMIARAHETQIKLSEIAKLVRPEVENTLFMGDPSAFYDLKDERWVLTWTSYPDLDANPETPVTASLFVAVSHTVDPLEHWTVYAFAARPMIAPGFRFCDAGGKSFSPLAPQVSVTKSASRRQRGPKMQRERERERERGGGGGGAHTASTVLLAAERSCGLWATNTAYIVLVLGLLYLIECLYQAVAQCAGTELSACASAPLPPPPPPGALCPTTTEQLLTTAFSPFSSTHFI